ncbi:MAG: L,D-transpeptidase [Phascolarctobacterium faecium]
MVRWFLSCVRMRNGELLELLPYVEVGTKVTIRE